MSRSKGQALVEVALMLPVIMFTALGFLEAGFLLGTQFTQEQATTVVATYAAAHHDSSWHAVADQIGLTDCTVAVTDEPHELVKASTTCSYKPHVTSGLWDGLPITTEAYAALPAATPDPTPSPS